ncbi:unnamed protein product, partial [Amoebophrya sp. A120]
AQIARAKAPGPAARMWKGCAEVGQQPPGWRSGRGRVSAPPRGRLSTTPATRRAGHRATNKRNKGPQRGDCFQKRGRRHRLRPGPFLGLRLGGARNGGPTLRPDVGHEGGRALLLASQSLPWAPHPARRRGSASFRSLQLPRPAGGGPRRETEPPGADAAFSSRRACEARARRGLGANAR